MPDDRTSTHDIDASLAVLHALCNDPASPVQTPIDGWTYAELADFCECSEASIRRRVARALTKVRLNLPSDIREEFTTTKQPAP